MTCKNCGYENRLGVRYCQRCGQYIEPKRTLAQEVKSWDFRSLAGVGRRDVNIAPLFTAPSNAISFWLIVLSHGIGFSLLGIEIIIQEISTFKLWMNGIRISNVFTS